MGKRIGHALLAGLLAWVVSGCGSGSGVSSGGGSVVQTPARPPRFVYVANSTSNNVTGYSVNTVTGALTLIPATPWAAGAGPTSVAVDPTNTYAYVANTDANSLSSYRINQTTGALESLGLAVATGTRPSVVAVHPSGRYVYVLNTTDGTVSGFTVVQSGGSAGALGNIAGMPVGTRPSSAPAGAPIAMAVDPLGRFVYVANFGVDEIAVLSIGSTGALSLVGTVVLPAVSGVAVRHPHALSVDSAGQFVFVANETSLDAVSYTISTASPWLALSPSSPTVAAGNFPVATSVAPNGKFLYVANFLANTISGYGINATFTPGALTSLGAATTLPTASGSPGPGPYALAVDATNTYLFIAQSGDNKVASYTISATGMLTRVAGSPFDAAVSPPASASGTGAKSIALAY